MLSRESVLRAIEHISSVGDTDMFPRLPEIELFAACSEEVADIIEKMNVGSYNPVSSVEVLTPKSKFGFRIGHQLTAPDILIYTAAVIENASGVEGLREDKSGDVAFSYRYDPEGGPRLFQTNRAYHDWLDHLVTFGGDGPFAMNRSVVETDIADFYQRIYFHRIEALLDDVRAPNASKTTIQKIVKVCRSKQSFGLPVGSSASRLLAEGLLCDTDRILLDMDLQASRYVDDFRIVENEKYNAHTILCRLAEHLMVTEGLSLNASKTRVIDTNSLKKTAQQRQSDLFTSAEMRAMKRNLMAIYGDEDVAEEDTLDNPFLTGEHLLEKMDEIRKRDGADYSSSKAILRVLRNAPNVDVYRLVSKHGDLAYYLPRDFCQAIRGVSLREEIEADRVEEEIWNLLQRPPISELAYSRIWLLNLYVTGTLSANKKLVSNRAEHPLEERQMIFIRAILGDRAYFRGKKGSLGHVGEWLKPALLIGASCLPADEYRHWVDIAVPQTTNPFAKLFGNWLKNGQDLHALLAI